MEAPKRPAKPDAKKTVGLARAFLLPGCGMSSDPIHGLAREFRKLGIKVQPAANMDSNINPLKWLYSALRSQALVFIRYRNHDGKHVKRQIYRAKLLGCTVVRWWVGSDVLFCRESEYAMRIAREVDEAVDLNVAVSPHLVKELDEIGIEAEYVPSCCDFSNLPSNPPPRLPKGVLTYLPTKRRTFYGEQALIAAIEANQDLEFFIIADESHSLNHYPNVHSLGWVEDLEDVWSQIGMLLRVTEHDGMPRMVLEALARSRYVIYSQFFEGCWFGGSIEQVLQHLENFKSLDEPNVVGPAVANLSKNAATQYSDKIASHLKTSFSAERFTGALTAYRELG